MGTEDVYAWHRRQKFSGKFKAEYEKPLAGCMAIKAYFDGLDLEKLPAMNMLREKYAQRARFQTCLKAGATFEAGSAHRTAKCSAAFGLQESPADTRRAHDRQKICKKGKADIYVAIL